MGSTSVTDVGSLFGSLNIGMQQLTAGKLSNTISQTTSSDSASFQSFLSQSKSSPEAGNDRAQVKNETKAEKPAEEGNKTSDRIAGEDKADAGKTATTENKQADEKSADTDNTAGETNETGKTPVRGQGLNEKNVNLSDEEIQEAFAALITIAEDFLVQISEILEITPDEAKDILAELDLKSTDLLNPQDLSAFALRAMGAEDSLSLLTNETHFEQYQNINEALKTVLDSESGIGEMNVAGLKSFVEETVPVLKEETLVSFDETKTETAAIPAEENTVKQPEKSDTVSEERTVTSEEKTVKEVITTENASVKADDRKADTDKKADTSEKSDLKQTAPSSEESSPVIRTEIKTSADRHENSHHQEGNGHRQQAQENAILQNQSFADAAMEVQPEGNVSQIQTQVTTPQEIANQIMDYMRSQVKPDMQTIEMQLHPASLGNIQISLIHKDGTLTANFTCQDEQVRAVLENQMIQLQERFEEQGIKVNSIEVSVGTHSFEQNMEQQGHQEEQQAANAPRRVRRLQLGPDFLTEDIEELEGDDRIAAEMMAANGGTMDVQV